MAGWAANWYEVGGGIDSVEGFMVELDAEPDVELDPDVVISVDETPIVVTVDLDIEIEVE